MAYQISLGSSSYKLSANYFSNNLSRKQTTIVDEGFKMTLDDVASKNFHFTWGDYQAATDILLTEEFDGPSIVTHFPLSPNGSIYANNCQLSYQKAQRYEHKMKASGESANHLFFEYAITQTLFERLVTEESHFLDSFYKRMNSGQSENIYTTMVTPAMRSLIYSMEQQAYHGHLQEIFFEIKTIELFLLQVSDFDKKPENGHKLSKNDQTCLNEARLYIEQNYDQPCSIIELAQKVGINQTKLKAGFKALFGNTVFGYLRDLQMEKGHQLLLKEQLLVGEVADRLGYKHAHHFAAAFKRKFGISPGELRR